MAWIRGDNPQEQKYFNYLERLRKSGDTNMWGADIYLRAAFPFDDIKGVLTRWMRLHNEPDRILENEPSNT